MSTNAVSTTLDDAARLSKRIGDGAIKKGDVILEVRDLGVKFWVNGEWFDAAEHVDYDLRAGEVLAIVGESGSGKTQSSMSLIGLLPANGRASGSAKLKGTELIGLSGKRLREVRGNEIAVIFQEPMTALNPVYTVGFQIVETLRTHFVMAPAAAKARALELMKLVEIPEPESSFDKFPHQLSGGQRQRIVLARAILRDPAILILDEATSQIDLESEQLIQRVLERFKRGRTTIVITHRLGVLALADRVVVMRDGRIDDVGSHSELLSRCDVYRRLHEIQFEDLRASA